MVHNFTCTATLGNVINLMVLFPQEKQDKEYKTQKIATIRMMYEQVADDYQVKYRVKTGYFEQL